MKKSQNSDFCSKTVKKKNPNRLPKFKMKPYRCMQQN